MPSPPDILRGKVLIVDNQATNVLLLERALRGAGYVAVSSTTDSAEVCALHQKNRYDLILLDLQMPGRDGFSVMAGLQEIEGEAALPVLVISAQAEQKRRALKAGAKDFISKPFDLDDVLLRVHQLLEIRLLQASARRPVSVARDPYFVPRTIAWIVGALIGLSLIYLLWKVVLLVVVALLLVGTFSPLIQAMEARGLTRKYALAVLILSLSVGLALLVFLSVPALIEQLTALVHDLPAHRERLIALLGEHKFTEPLGHVMGKVGVEQSFGQLQTYLVGYWSEALVVTGYGLTAFCLSIYLLADGKRTQGTLYAVVPRDYHMRLARIIHNLQTIVGGYMRGLLITSVALAAFTFMLLTACGVRNALTLALIVALLDVIPFVGGVLAMGPVFLAALSRGPSTAVVVLVGMSVYLLFEIKVLVPKVYEHVLRLSPAAVILALLAGGTLLGVVGALLALPIAAGLRMIVEELGVEMPGDDSDNPSARARDLKTEAAYELMSAGTTPRDAGQIANELAHGLRDADAWVAANEARKKVLESAK